METVTFWKDKTHCSLMSWWVHPQEVDGAKLTQASSTSKEKIFLSLVEKGIEDCLFLGFHFLGFFFPWNFFSWIFFSWIQLQMSGIYQISCCSLNLNTVVEVTCLT